MNSDRSPTGAEAREADLVESLLVGSGAGDASSQRLAGRRSTGLRRALSRVGYWTPVLVCMVLFGQVSFLGLRPAVCERRRLTEAQTMIEKRLARDVALRDQVTVSLRARSDPVFLERQRRLRLHGPIPAGE